jgi:hypothetical protein
MLTVTLYIDVRHMHGPRIMYSEGWSDRNRVWEGGRSNF